MKIPFLNYELKLFKDTAQKNVEIGESGTSIYDGYLSDSDYVSALQGSSAIATYDEMRKSDGVVKAALLACELPIRAANWYIAPASDEAKDVEIADFVSACLFDKMTITWDDFLRQALTMLPFGFSVFEKVFTSVEYNGKQMIGWKKLAPRLQSTILKWQTDDREDGITQQLATGGTVSIPIEKLLVFVHNKEGDNWTGISVLRSAYRPWFFKGHIEKVNAMSFERQGLGIPSAELPEGATARDRSNAKTLLQNIRANEKSYLVKPKGWIVEFMDMKGNSVKDPSETIKRYNREILTSVLAQFLDLGSNNQGSRALSTDHSSIFHNNLTAVARQVKDVMNKYAIKQLVDLNFTVKQYPTLEFSNIGLPRYESLAKALTSLVQQGVIKTDPKLEEHVRQIMDLPEMPEEKVKPQQDKSKNTPKQKDLKPPEKASEKKSFKESDYSSWRKLTFAERKLDLKDIERKMNNAEGTLRKDLRELMGNISNDLIRQFQLVLEAPTSPEKRERLKNMSVKYQADYRTLVYNAINDIFQYGKNMAASEMKKKTPSTPAPVLQAISKQADALTQTMADDMMKAGKMAFLDGLQHMSFSLTDTLSKVMRSVKKQARSVIFQIPAIVISGGINQGRRVSFSAYKSDIYALQRSEILDSVTCFPEFIKIRTDKEEKKISEIKEGDKVLTRNGYKKVIKIMKRDFNGMMVEIKTKKGEFVCTDNHPVYVDGKWKEAKDLSIGDNLLYARGNIIRKIGAFIYKLFGKSDYIKSIFSKIKILFNISCFVSVPVISVSFYTYAEIGKKKVNRISSYFSFLDKINFGFNKCFSNFFFKRSFANIGAITGNRTKSSILFSGRGSSKSFFTLNASIKNRGSSAINNFKPLKVYNLEVEDNHEYFANGLLVHNCNYCISIDSRIFRKNDNFTKIDNVHSSCRGIWVEIMKEEVEKPPITGIPKALRESFISLNVFKLPVNPIIKKDSPAAEFIRQEERFDEEDVQLDEEKLVKKNLESVKKLKEVIRQNIDEK